MSVAFLLIHDGRRDYKERTLESAKQNLPEPDHFIEIDDTEHKLGFAGAIQAGWERVIASRADWCFHCEGDFTFNRRVPLERMIAVLKRNPPLVQMALKRQPWNSQEKAAGGIMEMCPEDYRQRVECGDVWTEHRRNFTTNPCVYPAALCHQGWPQETESEGKFGLRLIEDPDARFAYWGAKRDPPAVHHIGDVRTGTGY